MRCQFLDAATNTPCPLTPEFMVLCYLGLHQENLVELALCPCHTQFILDLNPEEGEQQFFPAPLSHDA
jgi:hypothetical protein